MEKKSLQSRLEELPPSVRESRAQPLILLADDDPMFVHLLAVSFAGLRRMLEAGEA